MPNQPARVWNECDTHHEIGGEKVVVVESVPAVLLALALLGAVPRVLREDLLEILEALEQVARVEGLTSGAGRVQHRPHVLRPEVPVSRVDLGDVAEQLAPVDLDQDIRGLQAAQAGHEELRNIRHRRRIKHPNSCSRIRVTRLYRFRNSHCE